MAQQDYFKVSAFLDGQYMLQVTSIERETDSGQQRVDLLNEGLGGFTPGSGSVKITVNYAVPIGGPEFDYHDMCVEGRYISMQLPLGAKDYIGVGKVLTDKVGQSTGASTEGTITWEGELKPLS